MRGMIFHFSKSVWPKYFYRLLISNELRNKLVKFQDIGCALLRLAWVLSKDEIKELNRIEVYEIVGEYILKKNLKIRKRLGFNRLKTAIFELFKVVLRES